MKQVHDKVFDQLCPHCDYKCAQIGVLNNHIKAKHEQVKNFQCQHCEFASFSRAAVTGHEKAVHLQIKDQQCDQCEYVCARAGDLKTHKRQFHDRERTKQCPNCPYTCFRDLAKHVAVCTGEERMSSGEYAIKGVLEVMSVVYQREMRFPDCRDKNPLPFDFYIPSLKIAIEYDGKQHYIPIDHFGGAAGLEQRQRHDAIKTLFCANTGIRLLRIPYTEFDRIEDLIRAFLSTAN